MTDPEGIVTTYTYDRLNQLKSISHPTLGLTSYSYDNASRLESKTLPNGIVTSYTFDDANRLKSLVTKHPNQTVLNQFGYTFDKSGNRLTRTTPEGTTTYTYDDLYQLKTVSAEPESFTYDPVGNRLTDQTGATYTYDDANRLLSRNGTTYQHDKNGNQTSDGATTYTYDEENRLLEVRDESNQSSVVSFQYDPFGNRMTKSVSGQTAYYLYDEEDTIGVFDLQGNPLATITHGPGIDEPLAALSHQPSAVSYYYSTDGLGSIDALASTTSDVKERYRYASFGSLTILNDEGQPQSTSVINHLNPLYTFTAREHDPESSLDFYRARSYEPSIGRFIQEDPLSLLDHDLSDLDLNQYLYTHNNPINFTDPEGLRDISILSGFKTQRYTVAIGPGTDGGGGIRIGNGGRIKTDPTPPYCPFSEDDAPHEILKFCEQLCDSRFDPKKEREAWNECFFDCLDSHN